MMKFRLDEDLKRNFDEACEGDGVSSSGKLRELMREYVGSKLAPDYIRVNLDRPESYDLGAWKVEVDIVSEDDFLANESIPFDLPSFPQRLITSDEGFRGFTRVDGELQLGGMLVNGRWNGHCYSNGCSEKQNSTPISEVRVSFEERFEELVSNLRRLVS